MKRILIMLAAVGILLLMASCGRDSARVEICSDGSWLGDYTITGDQVDFFCTVKIKNTGSEEQKINLYGDFSEDMAGGLLKTGRLIAHPADDPAGTVLSRPAGRAMPMKLSLPENMPNAGQAGPPAPAAGDRSPYRGGNQLALPT